MVPENGEPTAIPLRAGVVEMQPAAIAQVKIRFGNHMQSLAVVIRLEPLRCGRSGLEVLRVGYREPRGDVVG